MSSLLFGNPITTITDWLYLCVIGGVPLLGRAAEFEKRGQQSDVARSPKVAFVQEEKYPAN